MEHKKIYIIAGIACVMLTCVGCSKKDTSRFYNLGYSKDTPNKASVSEKATKATGFTRVGNAVNACVSGVVGGVVDAACSAYKATDQKLKDLRLALNKQNIDFIEKGSRLEAAKNDVTAARMAMQTVYSNQQEQLLYNLKRARDNESAARAAANASEARRLALLTEASKLEGELIALSRTAATANTGARVGAAANAGRVGAKVEAASSILKNLASAGKAVGKFAAPPAAILTTAEVGQVSHDFMRRQVFDTAQGNQAYRAYLGQLQKESISIKSDDSDFALTKYCYYRLNRRTEFLIVTVDDLPPVASIEAQIRNTKTVCPNTEKDYTDALFKEQEENGYVKTSVVFASPLPPIPTVQNNQSQYRDQSNLDSIQNKPIPVVPDIIRTRNGRN
jgi:hypothetical protein